jgi:HPt (histidine-containing phosphotransfer) domain-containing protein
MIAIASDRLQQLQQRFLSALERRLADMTAMLHGNGDAEALMRTFHSLAGIGGTYGFPRITEISLHCEALCTTLMEQGRAMTTAERQSLRSAIAAIAASMSSDQGAACEFGASWPACSHSPKVPPSTLDGV